MAAWNRSTQPIVQRNDYVLDLQTARLWLRHRAKRRRLAGWMSAMQPCATATGVAIDDGACRRAPAATKSPPRPAATALILADRAPVTAGQIAPGTVRVVVTRMAAKVPGCPDNSRPAEYTFEASTSSNYGCATNSNLAAMIADPADLVRGVWRVRRSRRSGHLLQGHRRAARSGALG